MSFIGWQEESYEDDDIEHDGNAEVYPHLTPGYEHAGTVHEHVGGGMLRSKRQGKWQFYLEAVVIGMWIEVMIFVRRDFCYNKQKPANSGHWSRNGDGVGWWYSTVCWNNGDRNSSQWALFSQKASVDVGRMAGPGVKIFEFSTSWAAE